MSVVDTAAEQLPHAGGAVVSCGQFSYWHYIDSNGIRKHMAELIADRELGKAHLAATAASAPHIAGSLPKQASRTSAWPSEPALQQKIFQTPALLGVERMIRSNASGFGVIFSIETETGFDKVPGHRGPRRVPSLQAASFGRLRRPITHKKRDDKSFIVIYGNSQAPTRNAPASKAERFALVLGDPELLQLARWVCTIETGYSCPMEMEYAKDSLTNESFIVQSRPETVHSRRDATAACKA
ncbi:hypothetical protein AnigIFM62618_010878 [Aspergillus niger]|nr:hypothetical protein AnigIFM62618_010878 [Aspergillus niger]